MNYELLNTSDSAKTDSLISKKRQTIEAMKQQLKEPLTMEDERELLKNLSEEMRELLRLQEKYFQH